MLQASCLCMIPTTPVEVTPAKTSPISCCWLSSPVRRLAFAPQLLNARFPSPVGSSWVTDCTVDARCFMRSANFDRLPIGAGAHDRTPAANPRSRNTCNILVRGVECFTRALTSWRDPPAPWRPVAGHLEIPTMLVSMTSPRSITSLQHTVFVACCAACF